ncbi:MAG TPA: molybdenum ABC transporter ATP-binding protein [Geobacteraceae bacterium]|nr:molybdenum ABC transporter ATP-binding protein [Geobacteraceae bacterium]
MELHLSLKKRFPHFALDLDQNLSGERIGVFGPSGSGKSTLVSLIAGLERPDSGRIILNGEPLFDSSCGINLPPEKRRIGIVFQNAHLFPHLSVRDNLLYGQQRTPAELRGIDLESVVASLRLEMLLQRGVTNLSGGERQRVALGRALLANPRLLLMDEPLSALDDTLRFQIIPYLKSVSERFRIPYLYISHSLLEMRLLTEQVVATSMGTAAPPLPPEELALQRMGASQVGFINLLRLSDPTRSDGLLLYRWGNVTLQLTGEPNGSTETIYELSSRDIILCRQHPAAISARNLLPCRVARTIQAGRKVGVALDFGDRELVAEIVNDAATELAIEPGASLYAVVKASAFRRLG